MRYRTAALAATVTLGAGALGGATSESPRVQGQYGVFRVAGVPDAIDPTITVDAADVLQATCVKLMNYPDKPVPAGTRLAPEAATRYPRVSRDGKTYTFTVRSGFRFNTGEPVTAQSFARAIERMVSPEQRAAWTQYVQDIVGAQAMLDGKAKRLAGVTVRGNALTVHLTRAARDFPARTSFFGFCAVPHDLPISPEGVSALPGAGPYYVADFVSGQTLVLKRNPRYRGPRPHHVDEIDFAPAPANVAAVESGAADYAELSSPADAANLDSKFRSQLHAVPGTSVRYVVLNSSGGLFKNNAPLRRAVNFALDRPALLEARGGAITGTLTDQYLPPSMPGFVDAHIYPLTHPDLRKARSLARGHIRSGKATLYIKDDPIDIAQAQIIQRDLEPIGITVKIKKFPGPGLFQQFFTPGSPYDISVLGYGPDYWDPYASLNILFDGSTSGGFDIEHFDSPKYNSRLETASKLTGSARYRRYGQLDVDLAKIAAPMVAYESESDLTFVSKRVGCLVLNPSIDLAAVCLK
jgi:peptide/nickel transport system substrate-binding protein